jgi:hypothetical protein
MATKYDDYAKKFETIKFPRSESGRGQGEGRRR